MSSVNRCPWAESSELMINYHDLEWGVPLHDDRGLFEFLVLDAFQAGLSWEITLRKREAFRSAFDGFDPETVASYDGRKREELLGNPSIIRNRKKIEASIANAGLFLDIRNAFGSFDDYIWGFTGGRVIRNSWQSVDQIPAFTAESEAMSRDLRGRGFRFVGPTICYSFMQAAGMVNDHLVSCFRYDEV